MDNWTYKKRVRLYKALVNDFDSHDTWELTNIPSKSRMEEFDIFCNNIAKTLGIKSGIEIKIEIINVLKKKGHVTAYNACSWFENKLAAINIGFIDKSYMPTKISCEYK